MSAAFDDPRISPSTVRRISDSAGTHSVTLVGVVHDHPASVHRVETLVEQRQPAVLALELAPLLVPVFEHTARGPGREFRAAIAVSDAARVVGIDGPTLGMYRTALESIREEGHSPRAGLATLRPLAGATARVLAYRLRERLGLSHRRSRPDYAVTASDTPGTQAADERRQVARASAISNAFDPSAAIARRDEIRERYMAQRLESLRETGPVLAVVGLDHLDAIADRLSVRG